MFLEFIDRKFIWL